MTLYWGGTSKRVAGIHGGASLELMSGKLPGGIAESIVHYRK